ncbi:MAG: BBP7 family outer membrane beta-barrel protein [Planctomycetes bacterium]|nr:BBP7 family outer membrane beta-barrel protein [Planctomycetota bacterium]
MLLALDDASAQTSAPAVFVPFGAPTEYATPTAPPLVASRSSCGACSGVVGGTTVPQQPNYVGANYPIAGQVDYSNFGANFGNESGCGNGYADGSGLGVGGASYGSGYGGGCPTTGFAQARPQALWYASAAGLYMSRSEPRRVWTTYEGGGGPGANANQLMHTQDASTGFEGGVDLRLGRYFACNRWAIELGYWSMNNFEGSASQTHANGVSSPLQFNDLEVPLGGVAVADFFDNAAEHRLYRENEIHNIELNLIEGRAASVGCSPWSHQMLVGVRYFKFDEDLIFDSLDTSGTWGGNGGLDEMRLSESIQNDLIGAQVGCILQRQLGSRTRLIMTPKFGIYNNHIENRFDLRRGDGTAAAPSAFSAVAGGYPVESSTDVVSFLSEMNIGLQYQASYRWSLFGGYRVVAITGIGLADDQIPQFIVDIPEIADIDSSSSLVLHGAFFGATRSF